VVLWFELRALCLVGSLFTSLCVCVCVCGIGV
jgi:hypothetical protein